jgi:hypothetical protein
VWTYPGFESPVAIAGSWAERLSDARFVELASAAGVSDRAALERAAQQIRGWGDNPDAFFAHPHGEIIIRVHHP